MNIINLNARDIKHQQCIKTIATADTIKPNIYQT